MTERGKHIVIEGTDGTGKSTVANILAERYKSQGEKVLRIDEPDSAYNDSGEALVPMAIELRRIIKDGSLTRSAFTNVLLFDASRHETWTQLSVPALARGEHVIQARNEDSTKVYQGFAEGVDISIIRYLSLLATDDYYQHPDLKVILDLSDEEERQRRINNRGELEKPDTFESRPDEFQQKLIEGYRTLAKIENIPIVSAARPAEDTADEIWEMIQKLPTRTI